MVFWCGSAFGRDRSGMSYMSFVSITFDKCRYRLPKFGIAVGGDLSSCRDIRDINLRV